MEGKVIINMYYRVEVGSLDIITINSILIWDFINCTVEKTK
jgi:hypothetical protein